MNKEKISWWWFVLLAGLIVPAGEYAITRHFFFIGFLRNYFVTGMNPVLSPVVFLFFTIIICILFKILVRIESPAGKPVYLVIALAISLLLSPIYLPGMHMVADEHTRRYIDLHPGTAKEGDSFIFGPIFWNALILLLFLLFVVINFPSKNGRRKNKSVN
jgi:hypothetical protein